MEEVRKRMGLDARARYAGQPPAPPLRGID
jgi:hypothetical protein